MQILAASVNVEVEAFLHAGYLSAYPRSFATQGGFVVERAKPELIDVAKALELKHSGDRPSTSAIAAPPSRPMPPALLARDGFTLAIAFFFFAYLVSVYYRRVERPGWRPWGWAAAAMLIVATVVWGVVPQARREWANRLPPPWLDVPVEEYKHPAAATQVILHGLIDSALVGCAFEPGNLAAIQDEVAFPLPANQYTRGMAYAVKTYGRDGWGREFEFEPISGGRYRVASAGPDGVHGTGDDVILVTAPRDRDWEHRVAGLYVRPVDGRQTWIIHRVEDGMFRKKNATAARQATGTDLFDAFPVDELMRRSHNEKPHPIVALVEREAPKTDASAGPSPLHFVRLAYPRNE